MENTIIQKDYYRHTGRWVKYPIIRTIFNTDFRHTYLFRKSSGKNNIFSFIYKWYYKILSGSLKHQISLKTRVGEGLYMVHAYAVSIHPETIIGKNCNIAHGVIIGGNTGNPTIGNEVWIGAHSVIEGNVSIGNNVLIAPKTYVDFNVSDNSIVIGSPAKIIENRGDATISYIDNKI